ncbi:MAG: ATP-binding protein [Candidatus Diapherotrites archaeon]|nr:ATP-binding protein [Candidatus Diapherotrites archaeon]
MILKKFVDREKELKFLEKRYGSNGFEFIILYGRRRVGKTRLVWEFMKKRPGLYFMARKERMKLELRRISEKFSKEIRYVNPRTWDEFFSELAKESESKRFILAIDEFSYWVESDPNFLTTLQSIIDEKLSKTNLMIIATGSLIGTMESLLSYKNPLYGRRTGDWKLEPLPFWVVHDFLPRYSIKDLIRMYGLTGGIPLYLESMDSSLSWLENMKNTVFSKGHILYSDGYRLLADELREPYTYLNILLAINEGATKLAEISSKSGIPVTNLPKYLKTLEHMRVLAREYPVFKEKKKTTKALWKVNDNYMRFWLSFVYPYADEIDLGTYDFQRFKVQYNQYLGLVFEEISRQYLVELMKRGKLPSIRIGRWWHKDKEIDMVGIPKEGPVVFGEAKWKDDLDARVMAESLYERIKYVPYDGEYEMWLFGKGFKKKVRKYEGVKVKCVDLRGIERMIRKK